MRRHRISAGQQLGRLTAIGLLGGSVMLTGCGTEEQQASTELPSASSTSAEPTPELPPLGPADFPVPDEARVQTEAGAEAFLRYYVELLNRQQAVPAGQAIRQLGPDCNDCLAIARRFDEAAEHGYRIEGGELSILGEPGTAFFGDRVEFSFIAQIQPVVAYDADGTPVADSRAPLQDDLSSGLGLTWSAAKHGWLVAGLTLG